MFCGKRLYVSPDRLKLVNWRRWEALHFDLLPVAI